MHQGINLFLNMDFVYLADRKEAIPTIAEWYFRRWGYRNNANSVERTCLELRKYLNRRAFPLMVLAVDAGRILGAVQLKYHEMDIYPDKEHWLGGVFVPEEHRGKGIAARLVTNASDTARSLGVHTLYLYTKRLDGGLYSRLGWKPAEQVIYNGSEVLVMEKQLRG